jgi:hypothetical protein
MPIRTARLRRPAQVFLGLFVIGQLTFLLSSNGIALFARIRESRDLSAPVSAVADVDARWSRLTGQPQHWSLFAPQVDTATTFPAVELRWKNRAPVLLLSDNEPDNALRFFRSGGFRLRCYEDELAVPQLLPPDMILDDVVDRWRADIAAAVRRNWRPMRAFLRWRLMTYQREHPDVPPPDEVRLLARAYRIPEPGEDLGKPPRLEQRPVARWRPRSADSPDYLPIEAYNPVIDQFDQVRKDRD